MAEAAIDEQPTPLKVDVFIAWDEGASPDLPSSATVEVWREDNITSEKIAAHLFNCFIICFIAFKMWQHS